MRKTKILIIEDNAEIREGIAEILELANYEVVQGVNGKHGVELALDHLPDVILCDIMMPELDGYGVLQLLSKSTETSAIPFIFLTAKSERIDMRKGMDMGADDYLTKPFGEIELLNTIESRLKKKDVQNNVSSQSLEKLNKLLSGKKGLEELNKLIAERKIRNVRKKQVIYYDGDTVNGIYLVISGRVKTVKVADDGREFLTGIYNAGEYFGTAALMANNIYQESAEAIEDASICLLPKELMEELLNRYPNIAIRFIKILSNNVLDKEEQLVQLAYHSVRRRMAGVLIRLNNLDHTVTHNILSISRENLAAMAGMAIETVSRILSDFKDEGLVGKRGNQIVIINHLKLQNMKN